MGGPVVLRSENLDRVPGVRHGFPTREGGVSRSARGPLTLALHPEETPEDVSQNWEIAAGALGFRAQDVVLLHQVHGDRVVVARAPTGPLATLAEADGVVTDQRGLLLAIRVADCVPVVIAAKGGVAAAHSGWRGTALDVTGKTVAALAALTGEDPAGFVAAVGPCISGPSYEVGDEVVAGLRGAGLPDAAFLLPGPRPRVDLGAAVAAQLHRAGVRDVARIAACTFLDPALHSHRRDGAASGRLAGLIGRLP